MLYNYINSIIYYMYRKKYKNAIKQKWKSSLCTSKTKEC